MKVVDWPAMPSLSGREQCGVYWKEVDVLYHQEEKEEEEEKKRVMERVERKTQPLKIPRRTCMAVQKTNVRSFTKNNEEEWEVLTFFCEALRVRRGLDEDVSFFLLSHHPRAGRATTTTTTKRILTF